MSGKTLRAGRKFILFAAAVLPGAALAQAPTPPSATALLQPAEKQAADSGRAIFAIFHASW